LSEITSSVVDVSNYDNDPTSRLTKIKSEIPFTPGRSMALGKIINVEICESGWLDFIRENDSKPKKYPFDYRIFKKIW
jgi:hypothetical protein